MFILCRANVAPAGLNQQEGDRSREAQAADVACQPARDSLESRSNPDA